MAIHSLTGYYRLRHITPQRKRAYFNLYNKEGKQIGESSVTYSIEGVLDETKRQGEGGKVKFPDFSSFPSRLVFDRALEE